MAAITTDPAHHGTEVDPNDNFLAQKGILSWLTTLDHKRIGLMYLISVTIAFALGGSSPSSCAPSSSRAARR